MKEYTTKVVVVGSGSSGISAAFDLYENKIDFILLEKGDKVGGAGKFGAHGVFAIDSKDQKAKGVTYGYREAFTGLTDYNHYFTNGELLATFLKHSGENIDRLERMGLPVTVEQSEQKAHLNDPLVYHKFNNFIDKMQKWDALPDKFRAQGNEVLTETAAYDVVYEDGHLTAVLAKHGDEEIRINCQKIIFADGGYCGSEEMMKVAYADTANLLNLGERKSDGVGIRLAQKLGAAANHNPVLFAHGCAPSFAINPMRRDSSVETLTNLPLFWVDQTGHRFVNEDIVYDFAMWGNVAHNVGGKYFVIVDQKTLDHFKENVVQLEDTFERQFCNVGQEPRVNVGPLPKIQDDFEAAITTGEVVKADNLDQLAEKLGIDEKVLAETVSNYNHAVATKNDDVFLKPAEELLFDVEASGPIYAIIEKCAILGTLNGVNVDKNLRAVRQDGSAINDFYIVGNNVNGLYSDGYPSYEGIANGFAFVSGWLAAADARKSLR